MLLEKYGWTLDYLLWGISYVNVHMLMTDSIQVYYSKDDKKKDDEYINADDPNNIEYIMKHYS